MRLLVLGGTVFLGRHIVAAVQARGHELTLFNRGLSDPEPIDGIEQIHGDREHDLALLAGRGWDAVIDTSGYVPRVVGASARALADAVDRYVFVSSISAYGTFPEPGLDESAPTVPDPVPDTENVLEHYAELKAACERVVEHVLPGRTLVIRPGLIVGPYDPTERFTYWVRRLAAGGRVLAPRAPDQPDFRGFLAADVRRAMAAGLSFRPLEDTVIDTLTWARDRPGPPERPEGAMLPPRAGLSPEREAELLARLAG